MATRTPLSRRLLKSASASSVGRATTFVLGGAPSPGASYFWRSLMLASTLGLLGRLAEARGHAADLVRQRPDFPTRGRTLIGRLIKFPEVSEPIVAGLERAGLSLERREEQPLAKADPVRRPWEAGRERSGKNRPAAIR
jgi:hypothetical protein